MKQFIAAAFLVTTMGSALASEKLCYDISLSFNTHPNHECPALQHFCLDAIHGNMNLTMASGEVKVLKFYGEHIQNYSDVGQDIYDNYDSDDLGLSLSYNNDGNWPARKTGGYSEISLSTGVQERSGVYVSQSCYYNLK